MPIHTIHIRLIKCFISLLMLSEFYGVKAQPNPPAPDCFVPISFTATASGTFNFPGGNGFANAQAGCVTWTLMWQSTISPTVAFQSSVGTVTPTSFGAYTGTTILSGTGITTFSNLVSGTVVDTPWVRVNIVMGSAGTVNGVLYGYKTGQTGGTGGAGAGCPNPCPVEPVGLGTFGTAQQSVTTMDAALGTNTSRVVCVTADIGNTITIYVGTTGVTTSVGVGLVAGQTDCQQLSNTNLVHVIAGSGGAKVDYSWVN